MKKRFFLAFVLAMAGVPAFSQSHPGIQQKIVDGCDEMVVYDEAIGQWVCLGSSGGGSLTCTAADCPAKNEKNENVLNCFYTYKYFNCIKVCRYHADGTNDYGQVVDKSFCGK